MPSRTDREAMAAALGGMASRTDEPAQPNASPPSGQASAPKTKSAPKAASKKTHDRRKKQAQAKTPEQAGEGTAYRKTGTGYVRADGTERVRTVVMLTEGERKRLKVLALRADLSPSDYVRRAVGFLGK